MSALEVEIVTDPDIEVSHQFLGNRATLYKKRLFIAGLRNKGTLYLAAKHAGINRTTAWRWRELDMGFSNAWDEALEDAVDVQETSVYERGLNGSTIDSIFYLKAKRPQFRDKLQIDIPQLQDEIKQRMEQLGVDPLMTMRQASETRLLQKSVTPITTSNTDDQP